MEFIARILIILGGLNYGSLVVFKKQFIPNSYAYYIFIAIAISTIFLMFKRDFYLPFLGKTALPIYFPKVKENVIDVKIENLPPKTPVIYWSAQGGNNVFNTPNEAYGDFSNGGITTSDENGIAIAKIQCPSQYKIWLRTVNKHIHYRYTLPNGLLSDVFKQDVNC